MGQLVDEIITLLATGDQLLDHLTKVYAVDWPDRLQVAERPCRGREAVKELHS